MFRGEEPDEPVGADTVFFAKRKRAAALARELGLEPGELGAMEADRVERLITISDALAESRAVRADEG